MFVACYSTRSYDRDSLLQANRAAGEPHRFDFLDAGSGGGTGPRLTVRTASLAAEHDAVCGFTNDDLGRPTLEALAELGTRTIVLRCAGFNSLDLEAARELDFRVARVPAYSPWSVAEHTVGMLLAVNRKLHRAHQRVREQNFSLEGLLGIDLHGKTVTVVGVGKIGAALVRILLGFGCRVIGVDPSPSPQLEAAGLEYRSLDEALPESRVLCLTCPLTADTHHLIDGRRLELLPRGAFLVNTARGGLIDTRALIAALKRDHFAGVALDVYEEEESLFFEDRSQSILQDDVFARLLTFPNVLITSHQAFFTAEALSGIAQTTVENLTAIECEGLAPVENRIPGLGSA